ncbi:DUF4328 domain-containing protein [Streptomyces sp. NPDC057939]|uniref:DUF4328 domain-containing protein n=1 Tax=Streptomyces sp. NPDC057939 TaxID=3346284 RepID=UPI0036EEBDB5
MSRFQEVRPRPPLPTPARGTGRALLMGVCALLTASVAADLFSLYAGIRMHSEVLGDGGFLFVPEDRLATAEKLFSISDQFRALTMAACAAVFITWFHRMRRNAGALAPDRFRGGPGWAIGAWFVPFACFWMPYRIAVDMWTVGLRTAPAGRSAFWPVNLWWGSFAGSVLLSAYGGMRYGRAEDLGALLDAVNVGIAADVLNVVAAGAAVHFAVRLSRSLTPPTGTTSA